MMDNKIFEVMEKGSQFENVAHEVHNRDTKVEAGNKFYNRNGEPFTIVRKLTKEEAAELTTSRNHLYDYFEIRFYTGNTKIAIRAAIKMGKVKNTWSGSIEGIGILGEVSRKDFPREYWLWVSMIQRCYSNQLLERKPFYAGVKLDTRWMKFENFITDLPSLPNYDRWKNETGWELDKDALSPKDGKIYSKETCMFLTMEENAAMGGKRV